MSECMIASNHNLCSYTHTRVEARKKTYYMLFLTHHTLPQNALVCVVAAVKFHMVTHKFILISSFLQGYQLLHADFIEFESLDNAQVNNFKLWGHLFNSKKDQLWKAIVILVSQPRQPMECCKPGLLDSNCAKIRLRLKTTMVIGYIFYETLPFRPNSGIV